jgi:NitT/TauT family transport system substrate-binding protein
MRKSLLIVALLCSAAGCAEKPSALTLEPVSINAATLPHFSLVLLAQAKGYFREEGLEVTVRPHRFGKLALDALLDGQGDLATCAETPVVFAELRGRPVSVLATIGTSKKSMAVVARRDAGISRPRDLSGKRVGVSKATSGAFFLDTFLLRQAVDRQQVSLVDLRPDEMAEALAGGHVDAVATWNPTALELGLRFGAKVQSFYEEDLYSETSMLVTRRGFATQRPEAARRVLRGLLKAEAFFRSRPEEARRVVAMTLTVAPELLEPMLRQFEFRVRLDQSLLVLLEEEASWALRTGLVAGRSPPNFLETIAADPLIAVKPEAVGYLK